MKSSDNEPTQELPRLPRCVGCHNTYAPDNTGVEAHRRIFGHTPMPPLPITDDRDLESGRNPHVESFPPDFTGKLQPLPLSDPSRGIAQWIEPEGLPAEAICLNCGGSRDEDPRPGCHRNDFHFMFQGQQPTAKEYTAMISRRTDGSDPLVQEPKS